MSTATKATRLKSLILRDREVRALAATGRVHLRRAVSLSCFMAATTPGYDWEFRDRRMRWNSVRAEGLLRDWCPLGRAGEVRRVREAWAPRLAGDGADDPDPGYAKYRADGGTSPSDPDDWHRWPDRWRPATQMPAWAGRYAVRIEAVRVERVREITEAEAEAAGVGPGFVPNSGGLRMFAELWDATDGRKPGCSWASNCWTWAVDAALCERGEG